MQKKKTNEEKHFRKKEEKTMKTRKERMTRGQCPCHCDHRANNCQ